VQKDYQLAQRIHRGERKAFEEFVDAYGGRVHRLVRRYVENTTDAEDVTQEVFCDLHRSIGSFRGEAALSTWVYRVALNHCWKYRQKQHPESLSYDEQAMSVPSDDWRADPAQSAAKKELSEQVQGALRQLSPLHQDVVVLCEMQGMTYQECANALQIPIGTVKSRLFHAFRRMRGLLSGYVQEGNTLCSETVGEGKSL
jgi:RNA polymerase sigma-70 factor (ECF subfamily)